MNENEVKIAIERLEKGIAELEAELAKAKLKAEQLEKVTIRVISQVEQHQHLPDGKAAIPLGE